jgi:prepilin-type N-terminal cleavage/methylation domain-containing protein
MRNRKQQDGFTLIEVMIALLVFMVALLGLVALQKASIAGNNKGREHTAAVNIAEFVMTWLENEASSWPLDGELPTADDFPMLTQALGDNAGTWRLLPDGASAGDSGFRLDAYGQHSERGFYSSVDTAQFCVHYMATLLGPNEELLVARVRVTWPKWKQYVIEGGGSWDECDWPGYSDPSTFEDRLKYSEIIELKQILSREPALMLVP